MASRSPTRTSAPSCAAPRSAPCAPTATPSTRRSSDLSVFVPDRPGALAEALAEVARTRANVVEVHHERAFLAGRLGQVRVDLVVETRGADHVGELIEALRGRGFEPVAR